MDNNSNSEHGPDSGREVGTSLLSSLSRLSSRGHTVLASALGLLAGATSRGAVSPPLTGGYGIPSWLAVSAFPSQAPSSPNGGKRPGVAAAKRLARKRKARLQAKRSLRG